MAKTKSQYICQTCSYKSPKWMGQCVECGEWNTFVETVIDRSSVFGGNTTKLGVAAKPYYLSTVTTGAVKRDSSGIEEFDRVLGGGFVSGQVILLAGDPGIGKSTLLTQISKSMTKFKKDVVYVCGEESPQQIRVRADRMDYPAENLIMIQDTNVEAIVGGLETLVRGGEKSDVGLIIVDSIQTLASDDLTGIAGSVGQVRFCSQILSQTAKRLGIPMILIGHVTKEGTVAGPKVLEHMVDTVLYLEGDEQHLFRILKTTKNRFGAVSEVGIFEMGDKGLREVKNPSEIFLSTKEQDVPGSCVAIIMEGYRPLLFEVQALTVNTSFGYPRRTTSGFNANRLQVLIAILEKRAGLNLSNHDVYVNIAGGFKVNEYAADLAVCLAIASALQNKPLKSFTAAFGECGLLGEIRRVSNEAGRVKEAKKLGYKNILTPDNVRFLNEAIKKAF
jgi:DNA repair protein RadA/Sms